MKSPNGLGAVRADASLEDRVKELERQLQQEQDTNRRLQEMLNQAQKDREENLAFRDQAIGTQAALRTAEQRLEKLRKEQGLRYQLKATGVGLARRGKHAVRLSLDWGRSGVAKVTGKGDSR